jgi:hemerythrin-like domain-containing protein
MILFPALQSSERFPSSVKPENLLREHHEERGLIESAQLALFTDKQDEFIASARRVADLLFEHADKEEHVRFPLYRSTIGISQVQFGAGDERQRFSRV